METTYLLAGGDRRQFWLSRLLVSQGRVFTRGVPGLEDSLPERPVDVLILPTPCLDGSGRLRTAAGSGAGAGTAAAGLPFAALDGLWDGHTRIYGGALPLELAARFPGCGPVTDLMADPGVAAANGRLTAEAAVELTQARLEGSLYGLPCLVLGYGRVGKPLAALLEALHARVTVAARRPGVRAEAAQRGYGVRDFPGPAGEPAVIFNTVPAPTLSPAALGALGPDCLWVELASSPGGLPTDCRPAFPVLAANSLPGRRLPRSAAAALLEGILRKEAAQ